MKTKVCKAFFSIVVGALLVTASHAQAQVGHGPDQIQGQQQGQQQGQLQGQAQLQAQAQGQLQGQGQAQSLVNKINVKNINENTNINRNKNVNKNLNVNANLNVNQNKLTNENANTSSASVSIQNPSEVTTTVMGAPGAAVSINTELPVYIGPYPECWNVQPDALTYLLTRIRTFTVNKKNYMVIFHVNYTKSEVSIITDQEGSDPTSVRVFTSAEELQGLDTTIMATVTTHGNRKATTMDCFYQALVDTSEAGGNALLILRTASDPGMHSSTIGIGGSGAGNFSQAGAEAFSAGTSTGFSSNTGGPVSNPYVHGVALRIN